MEQNHQFRKMVLMSLGLHLIIVICFVGIYLLRPRAEVVSRPEEAQSVALYDESELPEEFSKDNPEAQPLATQPELLAFGNLSTLAASPTPAPTLTPTPTARPEISPTPTRRPSPTPTLTPTARPRRTPRPRPTASPRPTPRFWPTLTPTPRPTAVVAFGVPRRSAVLDRTPLPTPTSRQIRDSDNGRQGGNRSSRTAMLGAGTSITLDQEDEFPFPDYLAHLQQKIAGLWFPQGSGTVSVYLIIERNGKILKSGVDKGEGSGVEKLRNSVVRALALIKSFDPLPQAYQGMVLRVRIMVRR